MIRYDLRAVWVDTSEPGAFQQLRIYADVVDVCILGVRFLEEQLQRRPAACQRIVATEKVDDSQCSPAAVLGHANREETSRFSGVDQRGHDVAVDRMPGVTRAEVLGRLARGGTRFRHQGERS